MAQFAPRWNFKADTNIIAEGGSTYIRLSINRLDVTEPEEYSIGPDQYLELKFSIVGTGETLNERDYTLTLGEDITQLVPVTNGTTGNTKMLGSHAVKIQKKDFLLQGSTLSSDVYFLHLYCNIDGVWDAPQELKFILHEINVVSTISGQISNVEPSGTIGQDTDTIKFDDSAEFWVTPSVTVNDEMFAIGEVHYGSNSRLFVQAFGYNRPYDRVLDNNSSEKSVRVFYPSYQMLPLDPSTVPSTNRTGKSTVIVPDVTVPFPTNDEEMPLTIMDELGNYVQSGLKLNSNGQLLGTFLYESDPVDAYFRVRIVKQTDYYSTEQDAFFVGKRFKASQMWVCPQDISGIKGSPLPGHLYQLRNTVIYPYVVKEVIENLQSLAIFVPEHWVDLGLFEPSVGVAEIGQERTFRVIVNGSTGDDISFITDSNLGEIHVGEYFGHSVYPKIQASGNMVTYRIAKSSRDDITKYNLDLAADGTLIGTAYALSTDFSANDEIKLEFDVIATNMNGKSVTATFKLRIIRGFGQHFLSAYLCPSTAFERKWFNCISSPTFTSKAYYRGVDDRYGLQRTPRMLLKENFVSSTYNYTNLPDMKKTLRDSMIGTAPVPDGIFGFVLGNYKIRSALDKLGNVLYDVLYREIHPMGTSVPVSMEPFKYTMQDTAFLSEYFGLRENIYHAVGEDTQNLLADPDDFQNRALVVPAINGLSSEMIDTVPRYMNHPFTGDGAKSELMPVIPVAYCKPGQAEVLYNQLVQGNEHTVLVGEEFNITFVQFQYFFPQYAKYVRDTYTIQIPEYNRLGG